MPTFQIAAEAAGEGVVGFDNAFARIEPVGERDDCRSAGGDALHLVRQTIVLEVARVALAIGAEAVGLDAIAQLIGGVVFDVEQVERRVAVQLVLMRVLVRARVAGVRGRQSGRRRRAAGCLHPVVAKALIRSFVITLFQGEVEVALVAELKALVHRPIAGQALAVVVLAAGRDDLAAFTGLLQDDVYDPGDGVGAVLGGRAVGQYFDVVDGADGDEAEVGGRTARVDRAGVDHQVGAVMAALAVHQHQGVVRAQAAQVGFDGQGRDIAARGLNVQRRHVAGQGGGQVGRAGMRQRGGADDLDRSGAVGGLYADRARAGDDDFFNRGAACVGGEGRGRGERGCKRQRADAEKCRSHILTP